MFSESVRSPAALTTRWHVEQTSPMRVLLTDVAVEIGNCLGADVCSIYLMDPQANELVLCATVGLCQDAVGVVRMRVDEGLVGLVAERRGPVTTTDAQLHARFKYFPEAGEEIYESFLGVPIPGRTEVLGVVAIQMEATGTIPADAESRLVAVTDHLAKSMQYRAADCRDGEKSVRHTIDERPVSPMSAEWSWKDERSLTIDLMDVLLALHGIPPCPAEDEYDIQVIKSLLATAVRIARHATASRL